jgi:hypothetical protein
MSFAKKRGTSQSLISRYSGPTNIINHYNTYPLSQKQQNYDARQSGGDVS